MKKTLLLTFCLLLSFVSFAQDILSTGKGYEYNGVTYEYLINPNSLGQGVASTMKGALSLVVGKNKTTQTLLFPLPPMKDCTVIYIELTEKNIDKFVEKLGADAKKMDKWQQTATREHITNVDKNLEEGVLASMGMVLNKTGLPKYWYKVEENGTFFSGNGVWLAHFLSIDGEGKCYIRLETMLEEQKLSLGSGQMMTDANGLQVNVTNTISVTPWGRIYLDYGTISQIITSLEDVKPMLKEVADQKRKTDLFD